MRVATILFVSVTGCAAQTSDVGGAIFNQNALAKFSLADGAFVQGHALGVLYLTKTVPGHVAPIAFTYTPGQSAPRARVGYDWRAVIADASATPAPTTTGTSWSGSCNEGIGTCGGGSGSGSGSGSGGDGACETFLQPAVDEASADVGSLDLETVMTSAYAGQTEQYRSQFQAGVAEALANEDAADQDPGVEFGYVRDAAISDGLCTHSPLVLDLDGAGIEASAIGDGVSFDLFGTGRVVATAWPTRGALLALDRDGDGLITSGRELFGNGDGASNGFARLATLDDNHDGVIDARDAVFARLRLWRDANRDGASQPEELTSLAASGVFAISLAYETSPVRDRFGNPLHETGRFVRADGSSGAIVDVWFRYKP